MGTSAKSVSDMSVDELLDELIDKSKRQFIYGCGLWTSTRKVVDSTNQRISDLCGEIRRRMEKSND